AQTVLGGRARGRPDLGRRRARRGADPTRHPVPRRRGQRHHRAHDPAGAGGGTRRLRPDPQRGRGGRHDGRDGGGAGQARRRDPAADLDVAHSNPAELPAERPLPRGELRAGLLGRRRAGGADDAANHGPPHGRGRGRPRAGRAGPRPLRLWRDRRPRPRRHDRADARGGHRAEPHPVPRFRRLGHGHAAGQRADAHRGGQPGASVRAAPHRGVRGEADAAISGRAHHARAGARFGFPALDRALRARRHAGGDVGAAGRGLRAGPPHALRGRGDGARGAPDPLPGPAGIRGLHPRGGGEVQSHHRSRRHAPSGL
ncbi:MAG: hypothetical protein AVDCRST_MAG04-1261, partial [uncultured Acetobacteraceae bacterium]